MQPEKRVRRRDSRRESRVHTASARESLAHRRRCSNLEPEYYYYYHYHHYNNNYYIRLTASFPGQPG